MEPIPAETLIAPEVDLGKPDPAQEETRRRCIALTRAGARCRVNAMTDGLLCPAHAGRLDSSAGGRAKAEKHLRLVQEADERMVEARMGARAVIAARAIERASDLRDAFDTVLDDAKAGNAQAARTLLGYLTAAFPDTAPPTPTGEGGDLVSLSTSELRALAFGSVEPSPAPDPT
jgi:hypothetical protein